MQLNFLTTLVRNFRYGAPIIVVSGLPRSGTSMLMKMLVAGGVPVITDNVRSSDEDNPGGYFEHERIKDLGNDQDKSWLRAARGKSIKVISHLLQSLPDDNYYRVILMRRNLDEILASQNLMLERREEENPVEDQKAKDLYSKHLITTKVFVRRKPNFELLEVHYRKVLDDPLAAAQEINNYLGGRLDVRAMAEVVSPELYRNRKH
jgi:hypothetical protein